MEISTGKQEVVSGSHGLFLLTSAVTMEPDIAAALRSHSPVRVECVDRSNGKVLSSFSSALAACKFFGLATSGSSPRESNLIDSLEEAIWPITWRHRIHTGPGIIHEEFPAVDGVGANRIHIYVNGDERPTVGGDQRLAHRSLCLPWRALNKTDTAIYYAIENEIERCANDAALSSTNANPSNPMQYLRHKTGALGLDHPSFIWTEQTRSALLYGLCSAGFLNWEEIGPCSGLNLLLLDESEEGIAKPTRLLVISLIIFLVQCGADDNINGLIRGQQRCISSEHLAQLLNRSTLCRYVLCWLRTSLSVQVKEQQQPPGASVNTQQDPTVEPAPTKSGLHWDWDDCKCCAAPNEIFEADVLDSMLCLPCDHEVDFSPEIFMLTANDLVLSDARTPLASHRNRLVRGRTKLTQYAQLLGALQLPPVLSSDSLEEVLQTAVDCNLHMLSEDGLRHHASDAQYAILLKIFNSLDRLFAARLYFMRWWTRQHIPNLLRDALPPRARALDRHRLLGLGREFGVGATQDNSILYSAAAKGWPRYSGLTVASSVDADDSIGRRAAGADKPDNCNLKLPFRHVNWGQCHMLSALHADSGRSSGTGGSSEGGNGKGSVRGEEGKRQEGNPLTTADPPAVTVSEEAVGCGLRVSIAALAHRFSSILDILASPTAILVESALLATCNNGYTVSCDSVSSIYTSIENIHCIEDLALVTIRRFGRPRLPILQALNRNKKQRLQPTTPAAKQAVLDSSVSENMMNSSGVCTGVLSTKQTPAMLVRETLRAFVRTVGQLVRPIPPSATASTATSTTSSPDSMQNTTGGNTGATTSAAAHGGRAGVRVGETSSTAGSGSGSIGGARLGSASSSLRAPGVPEYLANSSAYWDEAVTGVYCEAVYLTLDSLEQGSGTGDSDSTSPGGGGTAAAAVASASTAVAAVAAVAAVEEEEDELERELEISHRKWRPLTYQEVQALAASAKQLISANTGIMASPSKVTAAAADTSAGGGTCSDSGLPGSNQQPAKPSMALTSNPTELRTAIARMDTARLLTYLINTIDESPSQGGGSESSTLAQSLTRGGVRRGKLGATIEEALICMHTVCVTEGHLPDWWGPSHTISLVKHIAAEGWGTWEAFLEYNRKSRLESFSTSPCNTIDGASDMMGVAAGQVPSEPTDAAVLNVEIDSGLTCEGLEHGAEALLDNAVESIFSVQGWSPPRPPTSSSSTSSTTSSRRHNALTMKSGGMNEVPPAWLLCAFVAMYDRLPTLSEADIKRLAQLRSENARKL